MPPSLPKCPPRFDSILNEWNYSEHFDFVENTLANPGLASDEFELDELMYLEGAQASNIHPPSEDRVLAPHSMDLVGGEEAGIPVDIQTSTLKLGWFVESLFAYRYLLNQDLADTWLDDEDILLKRWGLTRSGVTENGPDNYSMKLGARKSQADLAVKELFNAVVKGESASLTADCDLSADHIPPEEEGFPSRSPNSVLHVVSSGKQYIATIHDGTTRPWKLSIEDPLTLLQIEREGWHLQADSLIWNLIQKGLPFKILYPTCQENTTFYSHQGPVIHPPGKRPTHIDYLSYNLDVADFFRHYPHAHVAALCSGGIAWRIAIDVLPIRPFHPKCCDLRIIGDQRYWSPILTPQDVEVIVGVYKWSREFSQQYSFDSFGS